MKYSLTTEVWMPVNGLESFYEISNFGGIRSLDRFTRNRHGIYLKKGRALSPCNDADGYKIVCLRAFGKAIPKKIHRLVAEAFIPRKDGLQVNHMDCDKSNNRADNLEWISHKDNVSHAVQNGRMHTDARKIGVIKRTRLSSSVLDVIKDMIDNGVSQGEIAKLYCVSQPMISIAMKKINNHLH